MLYCVTDIGSNTVKMNIFDSSGAAGGNIKSVFAESTTLGLGGMRENGCLSGFGIKALCEILERYKYNSSENGCGNFFAFATASLRNVTNTEDAVAIIRKKTGISIDVLTGEEEALLSFGGMKSEYPDALSGLMIDMGGGSTELISFTENCISSSVSIPAGCVTLRDSFSEKEKAFPSPEGCIAIAERIYELISSSGFISEHSEAYMIGGTARAVFRLSGFASGNIEVPEKQESNMEYIMLCGKRFPFRSGYNSSLSHNLSIDTEEFDTVFNFYSKAYEDRIIANHIRAIIPERYDTIIPGMAAQKAIFNYCGINKLRLVTAGVREGYFLRLLTDNFAAEASAGC